VTTSRKLIILRSTYLGYIYINMCIEESIFETRTWQLCTRYTLTQYLFWTRIPNIIALISYICAIFAYVSFCYSTIYQLVTTHKVNADLHKGNSKRPFVQYGLNVSQICILMEIRKHVQKSETPVFFLSSAVFCPFV
jgi:uncharacterized membrane protein YjfL (UPF0719 family)